MRKGKRLLAAVLALVLVATLAPVGMAATPTARIPFWDVLFGKYDQAVTALYRIGVVGGTSPNTFSPDDGVTRAQMAAFIVRALGLTDEAKGKQASFSDVPVDYWASGAVAVAAERRIVTGATVTEFQPEARVTHAQAVAMLVRALGYEATVQGDYPVGHVLKARELGLLTGLEFDLNKNATRGEVAILLANAVFTVPHAAYGKTLNEALFQLIEELKLTPEGEYVTPGTSSLQVTGVDPFGRPIAAAGATFKVKSGSTKVDEHTGRITELSGDSFTVEATAGTTVVEKTYLVGKKLSITPDAAALKPGDTQPLKATLTLGDGKTVEVKPAWRVTSGSGTVNQDGVLSVTGVGSIAVEAEYQGLKANGNFEGTAGIAVLPATVVVAPGEQVQFTVGGTSAPVTWSMVGSGMIDQKGTYTAGAGSATIKAVAGSLSATATVNVITRLEVTPGQVTANKGEVVRLSVRGFTATNEAVSPKVTWTVPISLGVIDANGQFVATGTGSGMITAAYGTLRANVPVTVAGDASRIMVTSASGSAPANGKTPVKVTARIVDASGNTVKSNATVVFAVSDTDYGTVTPATVIAVNGVAETQFIPTMMAGTVYVTAATLTGDLIGDQVSITTNVPYPHHVVLSVYPSPVAADLNSTASIKAMLVDANGDPAPAYPGSISVSINERSLDIGTIGDRQLVIPAGQTEAATTFRSNGKVGSGRITATSSLDVVAANFQAISVGPAATLSIVPPTQTALADGNDSLEVLVEIRDANGNVRTMDNSTAITLYAESDNASFTVPATTVTHGVATFDVRTTKSGTYRLQAKSGNITSGQVTATFNAGDPYRVELAADPTNEIAADGVTKIRLKASIVDVNGNVVPTATNLVTFHRKDGGKATKAPSNLVVSAVNGVATLELTAGVLVTYDTFEALVDGLSPSNAVTIYARLVGVPNRVVIDSVPASVGAGEFVDVTVRLVDSQDRVVTSADGRRIDLVLSTPTAVSNGPQTTTAGVAHFRVKDTKAGSLTIKATSPGVSMDSAGRQITVVAGTADHIALKASPANLNADGNSMATITAKVVDAYGNELYNGASITLSASNTTAGRLLQTTLWTGSEGLFRASTTPGTVTISGNHPQYPVIPLTITTYIAGEPSKVVVDTPESVTAGPSVANRITVKARIVDANGNTLTGLSTGLDLTAAGLRITGASSNTSTTISTGSTTGLSQHGFTVDGRLTGGATVINGEATFLFTNTKAETVTAVPVVYYKGRALDVQSARLTTVPGPVAQITVSPTEVTLPANVRKSTTLTVAVSDAYGNPVNGEDTLVYALSTNDYVDLVNGDTAAVQNGRALVTLETFGNGGGLAYLTISSMKTGLSQTVPIVVDLPPAKPTVEATDIFGNRQVASSADPGIRIQVHVDPRNGPLTLYAYVNGFIVPVYTDADFVNRLTQVPAGADTVVGYIRMGDMRGTTGIKYVRVIVGNGLGLSPQSEASSLRIE